MEFVRVNKMGLFLLAAALLIVIAVSGVLGSVPLTEKNAEAVEQTSIARGQAGVSYASSGNRGSNPGSLFTVDIATGAATVVGATGLANMPGLAITSDGKIYGTSTSEGSQLVKIDAATGAATVIGVIDLGVVDGIAFDRNDVLYCVDAQNAVYTIDTTTAVPTFVGFTGLKPGPDADEEPFLVGLAFQPGTNRLFATNGGMGASTGKLYEIDPETGAATEVGIVGLGGFALPDLHFVGGRLFASHGLSGSFNLIELNTVTGAGTVIGPFGNNERISGLAAVLPVISDRIAPEAKNVKWDENARQFSFDLRIRNISDEPIGAPVHTIFTDLSPGTPTISVNNADGGGNGLGSFFDYSAALGDDNVLSPGELSDYKHWVFDDPVAVNFTFFAEVFGRAALPPPAPAVRSARGLKQKPIKASIDIDNEQIHIGDTPTRVSDSPALPQAFALHQNHPNPFNPSTQISFDIPANGAGSVAVTLAVYNMRGQVIRTLIQGQRVPGAHTVTWDGRDDSGQQVASGVYLYRLHAGHFMKSQKMLLLK